MPVVNKRLGRWACLGLIVIAGVVASDIPATAKAAVKSGGTVTFALPPANNPSFIYPLMTAAQDSNPNLFFLQEVLWHPLYWIGADGKEIVNTQSSVAERPCSRTAGRL